MVDVLLVNPPSPDGDYFIRDTSRVGRRSREGMVWPQTALAQLAAMVHDKRSVAIADCNAERTSWSRFRETLEQQRPRYVVTHATAPTLTNDLYTTFLAKTIGAHTIAIGTHVTPMTRETMEAFPSLDFVIRGEPEATLRELIDTLDSGGDIGGVRGVAFRRDGEIVMNPDRPLIANLDDLPLPLHHLLPLEKYRMPMIRGKYTFVLTGRGCPAACTFCIKHVTYGQSIRVRSPEHILAELLVLRELGVHSIHFEADLFTVNREQVVGLCKLILEEGLRIRWTCNSRVDFVDPELLGWMKRAGCWLVSWGIESGSEQVLRNVRKGTNLQKIDRGLRWSKDAGIKNWGYFILGLP
ncbi:MAG: radical SAM protein, partial [Chloroflexi bacterium]|nr:radical SAM protein [Chloroflexota bacterium]